MKRGDPIARYIYLYIYSSACYDLVCTNFVFSSGYLNEKIAMYFIRANVVKISYIFFPFSALSRHGCSGRGVPPCHVAA